MIRTILVRCKGQRICSVCHRRVEGSLSLPSGGYVCDRDAIPVLEALILECGPIGIEDEDERHATIREGT